MNIPTIAFEMDCGKLCILAVSATAIGLAISPSNASAETRGTEFTVEVPAVPMGPATSVDAGSTTPEPLQISPVIENGGACMHAAISGNSASEAFGCPFDQTMVGMEFASVTDLPGGRVTLRGIFGRRSEAGLSLDRQFHENLTGSARQESFSVMSFEGKILENRIEWSSEFGWSAQWRTALANDPLFALQFDKRTASAQSHDVKIKVIEQPEMKLSLDGRYSSADGQYRAFSVASSLARYALSGERLQFGLRGRLKDFALRADWRSQDYDAHSIKDWKLSAAHSGLTVSVRKKMSRAGGESVDAPTAIPVAIETLTIAADLTPLAIFPLAALDDDGWGALLPLSLNLSINQRNKHHVHSGESLDEVSNSFSITGLWSSPIGETLLMYDKKNSRSAQALLATTGARENSLLVDHSFRLGKWSIGANVMFTKSSDRQSSTTRSADSFTYYGLSASRHQEGGPKITLNLGRDALAFDTAGGDFMLRDQTTRLQAEVDLTDMLRRRTARQDIFMRLDGRLDFGRSGYEVRFLGETLDSDSRDLQAQGVLMTFGMQLQ